MSDFLNEPDGAFGKFSKEKAIESAVRTVDVIKQDREDAKEKFLKKYMEPYKLFGFTLRKERTRDEAIDWVKSTVQSCASYESIDNMYSWQYNTCESVIRMCQCLPDDEKYITLGNKVFRSILFYQLWLEEQKNESK